MSRFRRSKVKELFPPELHLHLSRLDDATLDQWEKIRGNKEFFSNSKDPSFTDYANALQRTVEKSLITNSEFIWH